MRLSGQPRASAASICGSSRVCSRTTPADDIAKISRFRRPILHAFDFAAEPMLFELGHDLVQAGAGEIHLVKRLHRGEPGGAALVGLARFFGVGRAIIVSRAAA